MKLDLERQPAGRSQLELAGKLALGPLEGGPTAVEVTGSLWVDNLESRFLLTGSLAAQGDAACGRCLGRFPLAYEIPVEIMVMCSVELGSEMGDTLVIQQRSGEVDLSEALREAAILALPQVRMCRPDCRGFCPQCGADLSNELCNCTDEEVDPRWDGLPE